MEKQMAEELRNRYTKWPTEELISLFRKRDTLTDLAQSIVKEELNKRGVLTDNISNETEGSTFEESKSIPSSLQVISLFFIIMGIFAAIDIIRALINTKISNAQIYLNFNILGLFIGPGLLRFRRFWRSCALVFIWAIFIASPIMILAVFWKIAFAPVFSVYDALGFIYAPAMFMIALWAYSVLTRPDVLKLFGIPTPEEGSSENEIFICDNCKHEINEKDDYCLYCGSIFEDTDIKCNGHSRVALGICLICNEPLCNECIIKVKNKFFCEKHAGYDFIEDGWVCVYETAQDYEAEIIKQNLDNKKIPCIIESSKDHSFQLTQGSLGVNYIRVPFNFVLEAEKVINK